MSSHLCRSLVLVFLALRAYAQTDPFGQPIKETADERAEREVAASARYMDSAILADYQAFWDRDHWLNHEPDSKPPLPGKADDASFLRRACVDIAGRLPRPEEVRVFLSDSSPTKRASLTDALLKEPGAAEVRFRLFAEAFRVTDRVGDVSQSAFIAWLRKAAAEDMPFDEMIEAMLAAKPGSPPSGLIERDQGDPFRAACSLADAVLGRNLYCAMCHDHPFNDNTQMQTYQFAAYFGELKVPANYKYRDAKPGSEVIPVPLGARYPPWGEAKTLEQRRALLASDLKHSSVARVRQVVALRVWRSLFGSPEFWYSDNPIHSAEPPPGWNEVMPAKFENKGTSCFNAPYRAPWMENDFAGSNHWRAVTVIEEIMQCCHTRLGELQRILARTEAYGREALVRSDPASKSYLTVAPQLRRLPSEVIWDALVARLPQGQENWRPSALSPQAPAADHPLRLLGRSRREWPDESQTPVSFELARFMMNGPIVNQAVTLRPQKEVDDLVLSILGRPPTGRERTKALQHLSEFPQTGYQDLTWALLNTSEFLFER